MEHFKVKCIQELIKITLNGWVTNVFSESAWDSKATIRYLCLPIDTFDSAATHTMCEQRDIKF